MEKERKMINRFMSIAMSTTIGFVLGTFGIVMSGHFTWPSWVLSVIMSILLGLIISLLIPARKISEKVSEFIFNGFFKALVSSLITNLIYAPIITLAMIFTMTQVANVNITKEIEEVQVQLVKVNESLEELESSGLENLRIENYKKQIVELESKIEGLNNAKAQPMNSVWRSLISSFILSTIICMIVQPLWLKVAFRKYLNLR